MNNTIDISQFDYPLPSERIAKFPLEQRQKSKLLIYSGSRIQQSVFENITDHLPSGAMLLFNNTKVVRARLIFHKDSGARIEVFCLEPHSPADYERAFAATEHSSWHCIVGNSKKFKDDTTLTLAYDGGALEARRGEGDVVEFSWNSAHAFGQMLELVGKIPIPPYLERESQDIDTVRYQTVYSLKEGSVAAPTAGLHFNKEMVADLPSMGFPTAQVTLHVGAGTFLPVKVKDAREHNMHIEVFEVTVSSLKAVADHVRNAPLIAVGTTSVRTIESLAVLGERVLLTGDASLEKPVGQWEAYENETKGHNLQYPLEALYRWCMESGIEKIISSTQIMITPGYRFRVIGGMVTNFHQPCSTLLLLISALVGDSWRTIYDYALSHDFRFLSYGDSSLLLPR